MVALAVLVGLLAACSGDEAKDADGVYPEDATGTDEVDAAGTRTTVVAADSAEAPQQEPMRSCPDAAMVVDLFDAPLVAEAPAVDDSRLGVFLNCVWETPVAQGEDYTTVVAAASDGAGQPLERGYEALRETVAGCVEGKCSDADDVANDFFEELPGTAFVGGDINTVTIPEYTTALGAIWAASIVADEVFCYVSVSTGRFSERGEESGAAAARLAAMHMDFIRPAVIELMHEVCGGASD